MWFSEVQMKYSIKHNLNKCQLCPALSPPSETSLCVHREVAGKGDQYFSLKSSAGMGF